MFDSDQFDRTEKSSCKVIIKYKCIVMIVFYLFLCSNTRADSPLKIDAKVDKPKATIGDIITYKITLRHDIDLEPSLPDFNIINGFDIVENLTNKSIKVEDQIEQEYTIKLRADKIGLFTIPPIVISFNVIKLDTGQSIPGKILTPEVMIEVASVLNLQGEPIDIKDIKDIHQVDRNWVPWIFWTLNIILLMVVLYLFWKNRKLKQLPLTSKIPTLSIQDMALNELETLKQKHLLNHGDAREHFFELSEIFRRYLGKRYQFPAPDWTTEEITEYLQKQDKPKSASSFEAIRILSKSDLIKFAKVPAVPGADEIESVRKFILSTRERVDLGLYSN